MQLSTRLDCDVVAVEQTDELTLLVELTAPPAADTTQRQPATLQVVLDRSGSMSGPRLEGAKTALLALVDRLDPSDNLGVIAFDHTVEVVIPAGPLRDKARTKQVIAAIQPGGSTDLSAGYLRSLQEARRCAGRTGATVLLVSDGHANAGVTDPESLGKVAAKAHAERVTTSTLGFGLGYDERLLAALARGGAGDELFAEEADTAIALISGQVDGLLAQVAQAASLRISWSRHVAGVKVLNDLPVAAVPDGILLELGSFYSGETRRLLLTLRVPGIAALGLAQVATLEFTHVQLPDLVQHTSTVPIMVNVVPGDEATGRVPDPQVRSEALFQHTQKAKRESSALLSAGRTNEASALLHGTSRSVREQSAALPVPLAAELIAEADLMDALADESRLDSPRAAKAASYDAALKSRNRGRQSCGARLVLRWEPRQPGAEHAHVPQMMSLEEWEVQRLRRLLAPELADLLSVSPEKQAPQAAFEIACALGEKHPAHAFFFAAWAHGGFTVERA